MLKAQEFKKFIIITSINELNDVMKKYASYPDWKLILVGDRKGPRQINDDRIIFLDINKQAELGFEYYNHCPENHYSRKNIGYLYAMSLGASIIAETDDDNMPKADWGKNINFAFDDLTVFENPKFFNVYSEFCDYKLWPRGFPLEYILDSQRPRSRRQKCKIGVWQYLSDNSPDVDAIYRLTNKNSIIFKEREKFALGKHVYCPFNSQNTFWTQNTFPYMYLPKSVTFRFTDILRGYIAQRLLWDEDLLLGFGGASVWQDRNQHDIMQDFREEIPMYTNINSIVEKLESIILSKSPLESLCQIYRILVNEHFVDEDELKALDAWKKDLRKLGFENSLYSE